MSAHPPVEHPTMPTMVSRLPKFGSRPRSQTAPAATATATAGSTRLTNGFYHHPGPAEVNNAIAAPPSSAKQNGFIRVPGSFSMKWRNENGMAEDGAKGGNAAQSRGGFHQYYAQRQQGSPVLSQRDAKKPTASSPSPQSAARSLPASKSGSRGSKLSQTTSGPTNGSLASKTWSSSALRQPQSLVRPPGSRPTSGLGSRAGSPLQKKPPASRSHSSESLGSVPSGRLSEGDRFRSRSLTQVRNQPSASSSALPCSPVITRSYSSNRAAQRGPPPAASGQAPSRGSLLKPAVISLAGRAGGIRTQTASGKTWVSIPSILPPSALKKPLLPSLGPASRPTGISYKLSRPSFVKQVRPLRVTQADVGGGEQEVSREPNRRRNSLETPSSAENSPENTPEAPEGLLAAPVSQGEVSMVGEMLEDMSLSSTSSLDRNDISQEYMDDFDNLGNGGVGILLSSKNDEDDSGLDQSCTRFDDDKLAMDGVTKATGLCFLDDGIDWTGTGGERREHRLNQLSHQRRSSQADYHDQGGSSLDLSPSDSCGSAGTYMWDEEGLEPLGGVTTSASIHTNSNTTHHIGSFDSDINSIDLLNNLDSCDLADDDLMLDVDFPEDASMHSDADGLSHMAEWRRRQLCWGTQDIHNENESDIQCYKLAEDPGNKRTDTTADGDHVLDLIPTRSACLSPGTLGLDAEELAEDCSAVRSQLEFLQRFLLQEEDMDDDMLTTDTLNPETNNSSHSSDSQVQVLLQEVQQLREELRSRDRTIAQLTLQLAVPTATTRCCCLKAAERTDQHTQTSVRESESVASQTPWRAQAPQVLRSPRQDHQEPLTDPDAPPTPAPPPGDSAQPETPADRFLRSLKTDAATTQRGRWGVRIHRRVEEESATLLLAPQPSKLRLFLSHTSSSAPSSPKARPSRPAPAPHDPDSNAAARVKLRAMTSTSGSSRLPKPKSH